MDDLILWMDDALIVVNKPAGLLSIPDGYRQETSNLLTVLEPRFQKLWTVHRLDRETSGVVVLARSAEAHHRLNDQFASREVKKIYHAIVIGSPDWDELEISQPLRKNGDRSHRTVIDPLHGKPASTSLITLERFSLMTLVEALPHTGYTHQIRAHLAWAGFPLFADPLYAKRNPAPVAERTPIKTAPGDLGAAVPIQRVALHARQITFHHPETGAEMTFSAPYPADFSAALAWLRRPNS